MFQVLHWIHDLGFSNLLDHKLKRFGTKITLMQWKDISKNNLVSLWSNPMIELLITTLKICWNPFSSTWTFHAHWINLRMWISFPFVMNGDPFTSWINMQYSKLYTSLYVDVRFERIFDAIYPLVLGVEVEANKIWIWIFKTNQ